MSILLTKLGEGTYANVHSDGEIAIKSIQHQNFESAVREIAIINACNHPNIIKIYKIEYEDRTTRIYMKKYKCDLYSYIKKFGPLPPFLLYKFTHDLIAGTAYMHSRGIIHCDLKLQNLLVETGVNHSLVICDFGIAILESEKYHTSRVQTCTYRAPEVDYERSRVQYSSRIDIWSIGCILFEMTTGENLIKYKSGIEDSSRYACELFNIYSGGTRKQRLKILRDLTKKYVFKRVCELLVSTQVGDGQIDEIDEEQAENNQRLFESGFIHLIAHCLHPNHNKRIDAGSALSIANNILRPKAGTVFYPPMRLEHAPRIAVDEMLCVRSLSSEVLQCCRMECLMLAERIYRDYISKTQDTRDEINYACVFIASCVYSGSLSIGSTIEKNIKRSVIMSAVATVMLHCAGKVL